MNRLEQIVYSNLDCQPERNWYMRGMLMGMGASLDEIVRLPAKDGKDYGTRETVFQDAAMDGFGFFEACRAGSPNTRSWRWTYCRSLRYIVESKKISMLMIDDFTLRQTWWQIRDLVGTINEPLKILQIAGWHPEEADGGYDAGRHVAPRHLRCYNDHLFRGLWGSGDGCLIFSPSGAQLMLDWYSESPDNNPEDIIYAKSATEIEGCFVVHCPWKWIGHADKSVFEQRTI